MSIGYPEVKLEACQNDAKGSSDIISIQQNTKGELNVEVKGYSDQIEGKVFTYKFEYIDGLILLDEGDLIAIWESPDYQNISILYEVVSGSIFAGMSARPGIMSVTLPNEKLETHHEYLIATDNECLLCLSNKLPDIDASNVSTIN